MIETTRGLNHDKVVAFFKFIIILYLLFIFIEALRTYN